jgi:hypothetical protein
MQLVHGDGTADPTEHALDVTRRPLAAHPQALNAVRNNTLPSSVFSP